MDGRTLTRITNTGLIAAVGLGGGHLLMPTRPGVGLARRVLFVASMAGAGALAGWRERRARENDGDEEVSGAESLWVGGGALVAVLLAWLAFWLMHGQPK